MNPAALQGAEGKGRIGREAKQTQTQLPKTKLKRGHSEAATLAVKQGGVGAQGTMGYSDLALTGWHG